MINFCSKAVAHWLIKNHVISQEDEELYTYAAHTFILTLVPFVLVMIIGSFFGMVAESLVLILPFMMIRKYSGGFHLKSAAACLISSIGLLLAFIGIAAHISISWQLNTIFALSCISLMLNSPIDSKERPINTSERRAYKYIACAIVCVFIVVYVLLLKSGFPQYAVCIALGLILSAGLQIPCVFF